MAEEKAPETINIKVRTMRGEEVRFPIVIRRWCFAPVELNARGKKESVRFKTTVWHCGTFQFHDLSDG